MRLLAAERASLEAAPIDITRELKVSKPRVRVAYDLAVVAPGQLAGQVKAVLGAGCCCGT